jgi:hypothetical protein
MVSLVGFNIGTDASVSAEDNFGDSFPLGALGRLMTFESDVDDAEVKIIPIDNGGVPIFQTVWSGGHGMIGFTRLNGNLEQMIIDLMTAYHSFGIIPEFTVFSSILNRDGSIDERMYKGVQFNKPKFGRFAAIKDVDQGLGFSFGRVVSTGGATPFLTGLAAA